MFLVLARILELASSAGLVSKSMFNFLPIVLIFISLAGIIYILSRHFKEIEDYSKESPSSLNVFWTNFSGKIRLAEWSEQFLPYFEKTLHKARIIVMKVENGMSRLLVKIKLKTNGLSQRDSDSGSGDDFWQKFNEDNQPKL